MRERFITWAKHCRFLCYLPALLLLWNLPLLRPSMCQFTDFNVQQAQFLKEQKTFDALEWFAAMCSHVPNKGEQMVRYYGYYSNVSRGKRKKTEPRWVDTLHPRTGRIIQRAQKKSGKINPEDLRSTDALHPDTAGAVQTLEIIHLFHPLFGQHFIFFDALQILR